MRRAERAQQVVAVVQHHPGRVERALDFGFPDSATRTSAPQTGCRPARENGKLPAADTIARPIEVARVDRIALGAASARTPGRQGVR